MVESSLWGEDFILPDKKEKEKKIIDKISKPKEVKKVTVEKQIKSKKLSLTDRLNLITNEVNRVLGKQKDNILCIRDKNLLHEYIDKCIANGRIDIDTETNNSTNSSNCLLMGACFYTPNEKQVYVPVNHRDPITKVKLDNQLTEKDIREELQRIVDNDVKIIMHNGTFDFEVIKHTCDIELPIYWDTMIAAKLIDENELAGLKEQYVTKIDPDQEKYSITNLFEGVAYADVSPEVFAYYAATDAKLTDCLYLYQVEKFSQITNKEIESINNTIEIDPELEVEIETPTGFKKANDLKEGDFIINTQEQPIKINKKVWKGNKIYLEIS